MINQLVAQIMKSRTFFLVFILYYVIYLLIKHVDTIQNNELTLYHIHSKITINDLHGRISEKKNMDSWSQAHKLVYLIPRMSTHSCIGS